MAFERCSRLAQSRHGRTRELGPAITIDTLVNELGLKRVDWIKMDIEGGEIEALRGAQQTLELLRPVLFIEVHETMEPLTRFLAKSGYRIEQATFDQPPDRHGWIVARRL